MRRCAGWRWRGPPPVRDQLQAQGVPAERLQLAPPQLRHCEGSCEPGWQSHVQLSLDTR
jgi:hypothetical protein